MACKEVQKMNEGDRSREDLLLVSLAKNQSWKRCPACKIYAGRTQGCWYMRCRKLPLETVYVEIWNSEDGWNAVWDMVVRGALAIAIAAAISLAVEKRYSGGIT
ncbi:Methylthioribose-1-phosphate isomerase-like protein [Drosera capensis]